MLKKLFANRPFLIVLGLLPLLLFSLLTLFLFVSQQEMVIERLLHEKNMVAAEVIDRGIGEQLGLLEGLAVSQALDAGDFTTFRVEVARLIQLHPEWRTIIVTDREKQLFNFGVPPSQPLNPIRDPESLKKVWDTGKPLVGNLVSGHIVFRVPVFHDNDVAYTLLIPVEPDFFVKKLESANNALTLSTVMVDEAGKVIVAPEGVGAVVGGQLPSLFPSTSKKIERIGKNIYTPPITLTMNGWRVYGVFPEKDIAATFLKKRLVIYGLGGFAVVLTLLLIFVVGNAWISGKETHRLNDEMQERKRLERAFSKSEQWRQLVHQTALAGTWEWYFDDDKIDVWSVELWALYGLEPSSRSPSYDTWLKTVHPDDRERVLAVVNESVREGKPHDVEWRVMLPDGHERWLMAHSIPVYEVDGSIHCFRGIVLDISERKKAEEALRQSEQQFRIFIQNAPDGIVIQIKGCFAYINRTAVEIFGGTDEKEFLGKSVFEHFHPDIHEQLAARIYLLNEEKKPVPRLHEIGVRRDGSFVDLEISAVPCKYMESDGALVFIRDLTELMKTRKREKELENQLNHAQKMEAIGRLAGGISHDFSNLLFVMIGYCEVLLVQAGPTHPFRQGLEEINRSAHRARDLTRQLLTFGRKQNLSMKVLSINSLINGFEQLLVRLIGENIRLEIELDPGDPLIKGDSAQIEQVLMNMVINARDAMPRGGVLSISVTTLNLTPGMMEYNMALSVGKYVLLRIKDTGSGMDKETVEKVFEPFFTTKGPDRGTGLGLATSYGIIYQHGGDIQVYSEPGKGTIFQVFIPVCFEEENEIEEAAESTEDRQGTDHTILVIEDDDAVRKMICFSLENFGYTVFDAADVDEAISLAKDFAGTIDLIVSDVIMPKMYGPEVCERILVYQPQARVLYVSGYEQDIVEKYDIKLPETSFLAKPFTATVLRERVGDMLCQRESTVSD